MVLNECSTTTTTAAAMIPPSTVCGHCSGVERFVLHSVRHEGTHLRVCTSCVLRLHPDSFCPSCFSLYPPSSPISGLSCSNCFSISHSSCVGPNPKTPYVCPLCISPNSPVFLIDEARNFNGVGNRGFGGNAEKGIFISGNDARILEVASSISCFSMSKAAVEKKCEAERRALEAVYTRKRAKQALEHMSLVVAKEKKRRNGGSGVEVDVPLFGGNVGGVIERRDEAGNGGGAGALERNQVVGNMERLERSSNGVLVGEINAVECVEKEGSDGIRPHSNDAIMDVDEHRDVSLGVSLDVGDSGVQKHDERIVCEMSSNPDQLNRSAQTNPVINNGVVLPPSKEDQLQVVGNGHPEQNNNGLKN